MPPLFECKTARLEGEVMANDQNLRRLTPSEAREFGRRGGKASGESRRRKADFRKTLNALLTAEIESSEWTLILESMGVESTLEAAVNAAMIREALNGNVKAYLAIKDVLGQTSKSDVDLEEQQLRMAATKANMGVDDEEQEDDGFLEALKGSVENDWADEDEEGWSDEDEEETADI